jgi:hypothetical protein
MAKRSTGRRLLLTGVMVVAAILSLAALHAAAQGTTVRIDVPLTPVARDAGPFVASVVVQDVTDLGAFQFDLTYDPTVLTPLDYKEGPFLGSSGRQVNCLPPTPNEGLLRWVCVTLGSAPEGPNGSGVLATVTFAPVAKGSSPVRLEGLILADPRGQRMPAQAQDASVTVSAEGGFAWILWGPVIGAGALVLSAGIVWAVRRARRRATTP